jgi:putative transposase
VFRFIELEKAHHPIGQLCQVLAVSRSGYYAWRGRTASDRALHDRLLLKHILGIHAESGGTYGVRRVHAELRLGLGVRCSRKRVWRLMRGAGLQGVRRGGYVPPTTRRHPGRPLAPDRVHREFHREAPDLLWVADITQHPTQEGWLYLAVVLDAFSRRVVGWAMADHLRAEVVVDALEMAVRNRCPGPGLIHHSDHGSQYTSVQFGERLRTNGILGSMGTVGDAYDNALAESFFGSLQAEVLDRCPSWPTHQALRTAIFWYIEGYYNRHRRHSALDYLSPDQYERRWKERSAS